MAHFRPADVDDQAITGDRVRKALAIRRGAKDAAIVVDVSPTAQGVSIEVHNAKKAELATIGRMVADWLSLDDDPNPFLRIAEKDPPMREILKVTAGLHQVRFPSLAEGVCYFMLTHRTSQAVAAGRKRRIAAKYGPQLHGHIAFPTLETLAGLTAGELRPYAANDQQANRLAAAVAGVNDLGDEWLREAPTDEVLTALRRIHGIGEFTAAAIALRVPQFASVIDRVYQGERTADELAKAYGEQVAHWTYVSRTGLGWLDA
jgi:DNA-3-methyladenine glycosylase II